MMMLRADCIVLSVFLTAVRIRESNVDEEELKTGSMVMISKCCWASAPSPYIRRGTQVQESYSVGQTKSKRYFWVPTVCLRSLIFDLCCTCCHASKSGKSSDSHRSKFSAQYFSMRPGSPVKIGWKISGYLNSWETMSCGSMTCWS